MTPISGRERDGRRSPVTSLSTRSTSPGRTGRGQLRSDRPRRSMPPAGVHVAVDEAAACSWPRCANRWRPARRRRCGAPPPRRGGTAADRTPRANALIRSARHGRRSPSRTSVRPRSPRRTRCVTARSLANARKASTSSLRALAGPQDAVGYSPPHEGQSPRHRAEGAADAAPDLQLPRSLRHRPGARQAHGRHRRVQPPQALRAADRRRASG